MKQTQHRPPERQWWVLNGECLLDALKQARDELPEIIYMQLLEESDVEEYGSTELRRPPEWDDDASES